MLVELVQTLLLHFQIGDDVGVGCDWQGVAEPKGDDLQCDTGLEQVHRGGVAERVRCNMALF